MIQAARCIGQQFTVQRRYLISSLPSNAGQLLHAAGTHWEIEKKCIGF
jgi:hypothetical protein